MVASKPITNQELVMALAKIFHRKPFLHIPAFLLRLLGEQAEMLLASTRAYPGVLLEHRFNFSDDTIDEVLMKIFTKESVN